MLLPMIKTHDGVLKNAIRTHWRVLIANGRFFEEKYRRALKLKRNKFLLKHVIFYPGKMF